MLLPFFWLFHKGERGGFETTSTWVAMVSKLASDSASGWDFIFMKVWNLPTHTILLPQTAIDRTPEECSEFWVAICFRCRILPLLEGGLLLRISSLPIRKTSTAMVLIQIVELLFRPLSTGIFIYSLTQPAEHVFYPLRRFF